MNEIEQQAQQIEKLAEHNGRVQMQTVVLQWLYQNRTSVPQAAINSIIDHMQKALGS